MAYEVFIRSAEEVEMFLNQWISQYVILNPEKQSREDRLRFPFVYAKFEVSESRGNYVCQVHLAANRELRLLAPLETTVSLQFTSQ